MSPGSFPKIRLCFFSLLCVLTLGGACLAVDQYPGDTAIYGVSTASIQPNVLIILDNSGSMSDTIVSGDPYDPATVYPASNGCQGLPCETNKVYRWRANEGKWVRYINDVNTITCSRAKNALLTTGVFQGYLRSTGACTSTSGSFALGNYLNWLSQSGGYRAKMDVAKEVLSNLLDTTDGVRFGLMIFNTSNGGHVAGVGDQYGYSGYQAYIKDMDAIFSGATTNRTALKNTINNINPTTWTPLAETLFEAMNYYKGQRTSFNGSYVYATPIEYSCQKNYVILITDGMSTEDRSPVLSSICNNGDCDGDGFEPANDPNKVYNSQGSDYLDDVAKYLYDNDMLPDSLTDAKTTGKQNVQTFTVGFGLAGVSYAERLLQETAFNGGGKYYSASSTSGLSESLRQILASIVEDNTSFVAPVLPVSPENRSYSGSRLYMGYFKPKSAAFWSGNVKKYAIDSNGNILDRNGNTATNSDGSIKDNAVSYWDASPDGGDVEKGGVGAALLRRTGSRNIYTYTGSAAGLTDPSNAFSTTNAAITASTLAVSTSADKDNLINYMHGLDAYDSDGNGVTNEKRDWILGDILHSKPLVVNYSSFTEADEGNCSVNKTVIFVGGNDGMLHAFNDCDGSERWAFIPPDLLANLSYLPGAAHTYYVDSSPSSYVYDANNDGDISSAGGDKAIIMFGERRGGGYYYALDVTDPSAPVYMWRFSSTTSPSGVDTDYSELGESWSEPVIARIKAGSAIKVAAFIGAGYDNGAEDLDPALTSMMGRGVYAVEIATLNSGTPSFSQSGRKIWGYTYAQNTSLARSIPSQLSVADIDGNGYADRVYAPDMGGNIWRFDIGSAITGNWTGRKIFQSNSGAASTSARKIFYKPAVTLEAGYEMLFFGTGDREHPASTSVVDRLYGVKDTGQTSAQSETDLLDATSQNSVNISSSYGWYIMLSANIGEKCLANATVFNKVAYFTTYTPASSSGSSACTTDNSGTATIYSVNYLSASAAYDYNASNNNQGGTGGGSGNSGGSGMDASDRSKAIGSGIPSGLVVVINPSGVTALVGSGGSIIKPQVSPTGSSIPLYWREVR